MKTAEAPIDHRADDARDVFEIIEHLEALQAAAARMVERRRTADLPEIAVPFRLQAAMPGAVAVLRETCERIGYEAGGEQ